MPAEQIRKAVMNLAKLSDRYILLTWYEDRHVSALPITYYTEEDMIVLMSEVGYTPDTLLNRQLKELNEKEGKKYMMFKRENEKN
jgi:hypothetical protein